MENDINRLRVTLSEKRLSHLIDEVQKHIDEGPAVDAFCIEELENFKKQAEYMRMYAFAEKKDPYRQKVFNDAVNGLQRLSRDVVKCTRVELSSELRAMKKRTNECNFDIPSIKSNLEDYVSSMTMASITGEDENVIIERHFEYIHRLFDYIITGRLWNEAKMKFFSEILSSPVIDTVDAQVLVSAITMSTLFVNDEFKIETLINVYESSPNNDVKGRALTGWVLALHSVGGMCDHVNKKVLKLVRNEDVMQELLELQMLIFYCAEAEKDTDKIKKEVMPGIVNNPNLRFNRFGIEENEEDEIKNIIHGDDSEGKVEDFDKLIKKLVDMESNGSDIYFGGFARIKNFSFFYSMVNWFYPFVVKHPGLRPITGNIKEPKMINFVDQFPFCNSDKYSFVYGISYMYDNIPEEIIEMFKAEGAGVLTPIEDLSKPSYRKRFYLQDLFRFFKLNSLSGYMDNPFKEQNGLLRGFFFDDHFLCHDEAVQAKHSLARFLVKRRPEREELSLLFDSYESNGVNDQLIRAGYMLHKGDDTCVAKALNIYRKIYNEDENNEFVLQGMVRCLSYLERYDEACSYSEQLVSQHPESKKDQLNHSVILIKCNRYIEADHILFKLHYEYPNDRNIMRVLAWCMLMEDKTDKSVEMYDKLVISGKVTPTDNFNIGIARWVSGRDLESAEYFVKYAKVEGLHKLTHEFDYEREFLDQHDIIEVDICMMLDLVEERTKHS